VIGIEAGINNQFVGREMEEEEEEEEEGDEYDMNDERAIANSYLNKKFNRSSSFDTGSVGQLVNLPQLTLGGKQSIGSTSIGTRKFGKIRQEDAAASESAQQLSEDRKVNIMRQLKAELDEEVKDRRNSEYRDLVISGALDAAGGEGERQSRRQESATMNRRGMKDRDR